MDLSKLSDADLQFLAGGDLTKLSDEGLGILAGITPTPKEPSFADKAIGVGEAVLNTLTGFTTGTAAGAVGGLQGILDSTRNGTFGTQEGVRTSGEKFHEQADVATYSPRTKLGQQYTNVVGQAINDYLPALVPLMPELGARSGARGVHDRFIKNVPEKPVITPEAQKILDARNKTPEQLMQEQVQQQLKPYIDITTNDPFGMKERPLPKIEGVFPDLTTRTETPLPFVPELYSGEAPMLPKVKETFRPTLTEAERIAVERDAELSKNLRWRKHGNEMTQPRLVDHIPAEEGLPFSRADKLAAPVEMNRYSRDVQQGIRDINELTGEVRGMETERAGKTEVGPEHQMAIDSIQHDLDNALGRTRASSEIATELGRDAAQLKIQNGTEAPRAPTYRFGNKQRGTINPEVFKEGFEKIKDIVTKGLEGVRLVAYSDNGKLNVAALEGKRPVALVEFSPKGANIESNYININDKTFRGKGLSDEMYKFASELGNDVKASDVQTEGGRKMWDQFQKNGTATGQRRIAKGQRGSIGFFGKEPFEKFSEQMRQQIPDITPEELKTAWEDKQSKQNVSNAKKVAGNISPSLKKSLAAFNDVSLEDAVSAIKFDIDNPKADLGYIRNNILARGRLGFEKIQNEGLKAGLAYMVGLRDQARITANTTLHGNEGLLTQFRKIEKWFSPGEAAEVIKQRIEAQFNPDYQFNLNPRQMKIHEQMNKMFEDYKTRFETVLGKPLHTVANYFPSLFYGDFATKILDKDGRLVAWVTENSARELKDATAHVLSDLGEGFSASDPIYRKDIKRTGFQGKTGLAEYFDSMLELLSSDDAIVQKAQQSVQNVINKRAFQTRQTQNRFKFKSGVMGAEGNKAWKTDRENYYAAKQVLENYVRGAEDWFANMESAKFLNTIKEQAPESKNTYNILQSYFEDIKGTGHATLEMLQELDNATANATINGGASGALASAMRGIFGTNTSRKAANILIKNWVGNWNPIMMSQNSLQPVRVLTKLVDMAANGGSKDVISPMILGFMDSLLDGISYTGNKVAKTELSENMKYQLKHEVVKPSLVESEGKTKAGHYGEKVVVSGGILTTEAFARSTTFNVFKRYIENSGYDSSKALELSKNLTHDYQVNYETYARAGLINKTGSIGEMAGRLQSFKINELTQLANYIKTLEQTKNPLPLATALSISIAMAGVSGMIGMDVAEGIYGILVKAGLVEPTTRSPRQMALDLGGALSYGVPTEATGQWLTGSLTTNIVGDGSWRNIAPVFAGIVDVGSKLPIGAKWAINPDRVPNSEKAQFLEAISPTVARGYIEKKLLTDTEGRVNSQYTGKPVYKMTPEESASPASYTNLRSLKRGETQVRAQLLTDQEKRIAEAINSRLERMQKHVDESVRQGKVFDEDGFITDINKIIEYGADPQQSVKKIVDFVVNNHMDNWFEQQVMRGKINLGNAQKKVRALDELERISK